MFKTCPKCKGSTFPQGLMEFVLRKCPDCKCGFVDEYEYKKGEDDIECRDNPIPGDGAT